MGGGSSSRSRSNNICNISNSSSNCIGVVRTNNNADAIAGLVYSVAYFSAV